MGLCSGRVWYGGGVHPLAPSSQAPGVVQTVHRPLLWPRDQADRLENQHLVRGLGDGARPVQRGRGGGSIELPKLGGRGGK